MLEDANTQQVVFSEGIAGAGRAFYEQVIARQLEGVMAKRLSSRYLPDRRSDAWLKIIPRERAEQVDTCSFQNRWKSLRIC